MLSCEVARFVGGGDNMRMTNIFYAGPYIKVQLYYISVFYHPI